MSTKRKKPIENDESWRERICEEPGCLNQPFCVCRFCHPCMYGLPERAHPDVIEKKKQAEREERRQGKFSSKGK